MSRQMHRTLFVCIALTAVSCGQSSSSSLKEAWDGENLPGKLISRPDYQAVFASLPLQATLNELPWSDSYWPTYQGGLSYRWQENSYDYAMLSSEELASVDVETLSPAEKYDLFTGGKNFRLTESERERTRIMKTVKTSTEFDPKFKIETWEGLCHGWAAAAMNFKEPRPVTLMGADRRPVSFASSDIKALLTYFQQHQDNQIKTSYFLGQRCDESFEELDKQVEKKEITAEEAARRKNSSECRDTNAGSFHLVLANEIALSQKSFVVDVTRDRQVWNHPVHGYTTRILKESNKASPGAAPGTVKEVTVETIMYYTIEVYPMVRMAGNAETEAVYQYNLELDAKGQIIGGSWISEKRPDFMWRQSAPEFRGHFKGLGYIYQKATEN